MIERKKRVLIVDDDKGIHVATKYVLRERYDCVSAYNGDEARVIVQSQPVDLVLLDLHMRTHEEGLEVLPRLKEINSDLDVIIVSANTELDLASRACKAGASAYLVKDHSVDQLLITIEAVLSKREVIRENQHHVRDRKRVLERNGIIGESDAIKQLMRDIEKIRRTKANVIIIAETGCGKELVARHLGAIDGRPFVTVDSATITSSMAESILFGHEKGAFTGATSQSKGLFEEADGGTIYFDEISNMPLEIQSKLLRVLQEKEVTRLGSTRVIPLDFRVICASNKDLEKQAVQGEFKDDLYQRLNVISLRIPPLRDRTEDVPLLVAHFLKQHACEGSPTGMSNEAMDLLVRYRWPGNVRELSNLIANLCTMVTDHETIQVDDLPTKIREGSCIPSHTWETDRQQSAPAVGLDISEIIATPQSSYYGYMQSLEGRVLKQLYQAFEGNVSRMSKNLKISRSHRYSKLHAHRILMH